LPHRIRASLVASITLATTILMAVPAAGAVVPPKVAIIVGPTGAGTDRGRSNGDEIAAAAVAAGASVVKAYSPKATWAKVKAAVNGANIVVYIGHGNGFPNPYTSPPNSTSATELTDRDNGFGLNRTETGGDGDSWSSTMVYCGEKALLGTLTSSDGAAQRTYCSGGPITPAPNWVLINVDACYAPGASEPGQPKASESLAYEHVRNFSTPSLKLGAAAYYATDIDGAQLVDEVLRNPNLTWTDITRAADGYDEVAQRHFAHPDVANKQIWIQRTGSDPDYRLAFAGNPLGTPAGGTGTPLPVAPVVTIKTPTGGATNVVRGTTVTATFNEPVTGVNTSSFRLRDSGGTALAATVAYDAGHMRATLTPSAPLTYEANYSASLTSAVQSAEGLSLASTSWSFTVQPDPVGDGTAYDPPAMLSFKFGTHTGYQFDLNGKPTAVKTATLASNSGAHTSIRRTLTGQSGVWFYVVDGIWAGYWVRRSNAVYLSGGTQPGGSGTPATFNPAVALTFKLGTHSGYQFSSTGAMTAQKTYTLASNSSASASARATITNQYGTWFSITNGVWAGYWIRESSVVFLPPT
jgi:hypothetical protein